MIASMNKVSDPITITVPPLPFCQVLHIASVIHHLAVAPCLLILPPCDDDGATIGTPGGPAPLSIGRNRSKVSKRIFDRHHSWHARLRSMLPTKHMNSDSPVCSPLTHVRTPNRDVIFWYLVPYERTHCRL